jgi:hypothetical protein
MLACTICETKAEYKIVVESESTTHSLFYCKKHKPIMVIHAELKKNQQVSSKKLIKHLIQGINKKGYFEVRD